MSPRTVTDGPFAETKESIAGFWLWQLRSMPETAAAMTRNRPERATLLRRAGKCR